MTQGHDIDKNGRYIICYLWFFKLNFVQRKGTENTPEVTLKTDCFLQEGLVKYLNFSHLH